LVRARCAAPFLALAPAASRTARWPTGATIGAGVLLGFGCCLSYGLDPDGSTRRRGAAGRPHHQTLYGVVLGALALAVAFTVFGFWWFDGYIAVKVRYYQGVAADRPNVYWVWASYASLLCAVGLASSAALPISVSWPKLRTLTPLNATVVAFLLAGTLADLSGLSKAGTERIWLPFAIWMLAAPALLPPAQHRLWLAVQAVGALAINHLILTTW
jgi:hypothetical protein